MSFRYQRIRCRSKLLIYIDLLKTLKIVFDFLHDTVLFSHSIHTRAHTSSDRLSLVTQADSGISASLLMLVVCIIDLCLTYCSDRSEIDRNLEASRHDLMCTEEFFIYSLHVLHYLFFVFRQLISDHVYILLYRVRCIVSHLSSTFHESIRLFSLLSNNSI